MTGGRLIDAHVHLDLFPEPGDVLEQIEFIDAEVVAVTNAPSVFWFTEKIANENPRVHPAVGLHPELVGTHGGELPDLLSILPEVKFVGEVGLDYSSSDNSTRRDQRRVFEAILQGCSELGGRVLSVHSRRAAGDVLSMVKMSAPGRVILHWFSGSARQLEQAIQAGCYFSVNSAMVRAKKGIDLIRRMPQEQVLTESDGPFVREGARGADPRDVENAVKALAGVWGCSRSAATQIVNENFTRVCRGDPVDQRLRITPPNT